jgi:hypothetical protein
MGYQSNAAFGHAFFRKYGVGPGKLRHDAHALRCKAIDVAAADARSDPTAPSHCRPLPTLGTRYPTRPLIKRRCPCAQRARSRRMRCWLRITILHRHANLGQVVVKLQNWPGRNDGGHVAVRPNQHPWTRTRMPPHVTQLRSTPTTTGRQPGVAGAPADPITGRFLNADGVNRH